MCKRSDRAGGGRADADGIPRPPLGRFLPELYPQKALKCARAVIKKSRQKSVKLALPPFRQPSWRLDWSASCKEAEGLGRIVGSLWPQRPGRAARVIGLGHNPPRCIDRQDRCDFSKVGGKDVNVSRTLTIRLHTIGQTSTDAVGRSCGVILASVRPGKRAESFPEASFRIQCWLVSSRRSRCLTAANTKFCRRGVRRR